jgi:hypothetical protein
LEEQWEFEGEIKGEWEFEGGIKGEFWRVTSAFWLDKAYISMRKA